MDRSKLLEEIADAIKKEVSQNGMEENEFSTNELSVALDMKMENARALLERLALAGKIQKRKINRSKIGWSYIKK